MFLLVISEMLRPFVNILTSYEMNSYVDSENLREPIQMQLYKQQKKFSQFSVSLMKCK